MLKTNNMIEIIIVFLYFFIAGLVGTILFKIIDSDFPEPLAVIGGLLWIACVPILLGVGLGKLIVKIVKNK